MAYNLITADSFRRDLDAVLGYLVLSLENKPAAAALLDAVEASYHEIARMPLMYEACRDPYLKELGYRKAVVRSYIMVYRVNEETKTVYILRLFHGSQDYEKLI